MSILHRGRTFGSQRGCERMAIARFKNFLLVAWTLTLGACSGQFDTEPLVEYSTELSVQGDAPQHLARQLRAGVYLVEVRERDIDLRVDVETDGTRTALADAYLRHGIHRTVVSLEGPATLRLTLASIDQRSWSGAAGLRILRWPQKNPQAPP